MGPGIVTIVLAAAYFLIAQRVLDRMHLTDWAAVLVLAAIVAGTLVDVPLAGATTVNLGGLLAIGLALYVLVRADTGYERARALVAAAVTAGLMYLYPVIARVPEPGLDLLYWHGPAAGAIAYVLGRSRRAAFVGGTLSVLILDLGHLLTARRQGVVAPAAIAGAGAFDALVLAGISAVVIAEVAGEISERLARGSGEGPR